MKVEFLNIENVSKFRKFVRIASLFLGLREIENGRQSILTISRLTWMASSPYVASLYLVSSSGLRAYSGMLSEGFTPDELAGNLEFRLTSKGNFSCIEELELVAESRGIEAMEVC